MASKDPTTVHDFFEYIFKDFNLQRWLSWPPDVFAITSLILKRTGAYVCTVLPPNGEKWPEAKEWQSDLKKVKEEWLEWVLGQGKEKAPAFILKKKNWLEYNWDDVTLDMLRQLSSEKQLSETDLQKTWKVCQAILELHALADETCAGFGLPLGNPWGTDENQIILQSIANMLLAHTGSLSRLPTHIVRVLPKLRTPGVGLTLRSLSNNLSAHETEVEINWRAMPWVNIDENTVNILIVPWPFEMEATQFRQSPYSTQRESFEPTRYFEYTIDQNKEFAAKRLLGLLENAERSVGRVHMVVFPELALSEENYAGLLDAVANEKQRDRMPMILAGVKVEKEPPGKNIIVLSTFFAGKWYKMEQDKHHRWKLDSKQIQQYNLGGVLAGNRKWWEAIKIPNRRLSILAPNSWLSLCHLICEDLARLEPVSEAIRGIGPTLLIALLLDGPQLKDRWPGRYASVLADDPGSSVLTVSALGFTKRSIPPTPDQSLSRVIALWKDQITGWKEISIDENKEGVVLTVTADWVEEYTVDGRGDGKTAAVFSLEGVHQIEPAKPEFQRARDTESNNHQINFIESEPQDLIEVSLFSYFVDAILDVPKDVVDAMSDWVLGKKDSKALQGFRPKKEIREKIIRGTEELFESERKNENFRPFVNWVCELIKKNPNTTRGKKVSTEDSMPYYRKMVDLVSNILSKIMSPNFIDNVTKDNILDGLGDKLDIPNPLIPKDARNSRKIRIYIYGCLAILWAIHSRLNDRRQTGKLNNDGPILLHQIEQLLAIDYDKRWYEARALEERKTTGK